jgi:hypothetical protein
VEYFIGIYSLIGFMVCFIIRDLTSHQEITAGYLAALVFMGIFWPLTAIMMD